MSDDPAATGEVSEQDEVMKAPATLSQHDVEKQEEAKLSVRYPAAMKPMAGHSAFLQKRLAKGQKYFDSGDYQVAKQTGKSSNVFSSRIMPPILSVAPEIPTPESVSHRKTSLVQPMSKLANANS